jgi:hypothetical protein
MNGLKRICGSVGCGSRCMGMANVRLQVCFFVPVCVVDGNIVLDLCIPYPPGYHDPTLYYTPFPRQVFPSVTPCARAQP